MLFATVAKAHLLAYDKNGNRIQDRAWGTAVIPQYVQNYDESSGTALGAPVLTGYVSQQAIQTQWYSYDAMNRLTKVSTGAYGQVQTGQVQTGVDESTNSPIYSPVYTTDALGQDQAITLDTRFYDGASRVIQSGPAGSLPTAYLAALTQGNADLSGATTTTTRYDAAGRVVTQQVFNEADPTRSYTTYYQLFAPTTTPGPFDAPAAPGASGYDAAGNLLAYRLVRTSGSDFIVETHVLTQQKLDTYKEQSETVVDVNTSSGNATSGITSMSYDANGFLRGVTDSAAPANSRTLYNDAQGHVLLKDQQGQLHQLVANGEVLGIYGQTLSAYQPPPPAPIPTDESSAPIYPVAAPAYTVTGNFDLAYQPVTNSYPAAATGSYPVQSGDTLKGIAQSAYGDSSLWYLIADANGLSGDSDLRVGQILNIPTKVGGVHNSSSTYAPYEPGRIVGSTGPQLPTPAGRQEDGGGCGIGQIVMVVVAVVVTIYTAGAASESLAGAVGTGAAGTEVGTTAAVAAAGGTSTFSIGLSALAGGYGTSTAVIAGALGGAVGSIASQAVGIGIGAQQDFSWSAVAEGAIGGAISGGLGGTAPLGGASTTLGNTIARAAIGNALGQGIGVAVGLQQHFSWTNVAASAIGAGAGWGLSEGLSLTNNGVPTNAYSGLDKFGRTALSSFGAGLATAAAKGGRINAAQVAVDAFGNALGDSIAAANGQGSNVQNGQAAADAQSGRAQNLVQLQAWADGYSGGGAGMGNQGATAVVAPPSLMYGGAENSSTASMFPTPQIVSSGQSYALYDNTAETSGIAQPGVGDVVAALPPSPYQWVSNQWIGREVGYLVPGHWIDTGSAPAPSALADAQASSNAFYTDNIANASNPFAAVGYTLGRAANNAGYDIANGFAGLANLATNAEARANLIVAGVNAIAHPLDTGTALYSAGAKYVSNTSIGQMGEDALRFGLGGLATAGIGKGATAVGGLAVDGTVAAGRWIAPAVGDAAESYMARIGGLAYAVEPGAPAGGAAAAGMEAASGLGEGSIALSGRALASAEVGASVGTVAVDAADAAADAAAAFRANFVGPTIGKSGFISSTEFADASYLRYQGYVDDAYASARAAEDRGALTGNPNTRIGTAVDRESAARFGNWLNSEGIAEGPGSMIQANRWLRDPSSGSKLYVRPDFRIPSTGVSLDATVGMKWSTDTQIMRFSTFSGGDRITIVRPQQLGGSYSIWP